MRQQRAERLCRRREGFACASNRDSFPRPPAAEPLGSLLAHIRKSPWGSAVIEIPRAWYTILV
jgi:hypothetical protein